MQIVKVLLSHEFVRLKTENFIRRMADVCIESFGVHLPDHLTTLTGDLFETIMTLPQCFFYPFLFSDVTDSGDMKGAPVPDEKPPDNLNRKNSAIVPAMIAQGHPDCSLRCFGSDFLRLFSLRRQIGIFHRENYIMRISVHFTCCGI